MKSTHLLLTHILSCIFLSSATAAPLSTTPKVPNYNLSTSENGTALSFTFWREDLASSKSTVLMKVETAGTGKVFLCGSSFKVVQNGQQFGSLKLNSGEDSKQCHVFQSVKTFTFDQTVSKKFDDKAAFTVSYNTKKIDIPIRPANSGGTTVNQNLNIHMPSATYQSPQGSVNISADLEYKGVDKNGEHIWKLKGYQIKQ